MNTVYVIVLTIVMLISIIGTLLNNKGKKEGEEKTNKPGKIALWIIIIILIVVAGFRDLSYKSIDETLYRNYFTRVANTGIQARSDTGEIGYWLINYLLTNITSNNQAIILFCAIVTNILIVKNLYKHSRYFNFTLFLYITMGTYSSAFNGMRQYLAAAILFQGINYVIDKKMIKYIICVLIATSIHFSAIIMLPMYWLVRIKNKKKLYLGMIIGGIIFYIAFSTIILKLSNVFVKLSGYYEGFINEGRGVKIIRIIVMSLPIILIATQYRKIIKRDKKLEIIYVYSFISMLLMMCSYKYVYIARLCIYFDMYELLIIPELIYLLNKQKNRIIVLLLTCALYFIFGFVSESKGLAEYRTSGNKSIPAITIFE